MPTPRLAEQTITDATLELLRSHGPGAVTIEAVASRTGAARTTIYRRFKNRREMLVAALSPLSTPRPLDADAPAETRMRWVIARSIDAVRDGIGFGGMAALVTDADREFNELFREILVDYRSLILSVIDDGRADGSFRADLDGDTLIDAIVGAYFSEQARCGEIGPDWQERLFGLFWPGVAA
ncbi:TetR/AcrR family transcriptional regulator [Williamsia serinedens]|uniref:Transcriptional regulator, TetR family n=1 Tax=Williamsia serinedens TaxID=391736 RepID=A0ABT1H705_9NOCA|nr:TetR/AcrR family transcriptional regulator [Williamsia serinedens]MCP2163011.1 transcriptional regulator, TetR family [Williamsia serinedens]